MKFDCRWAVLVLAGLLVAAGCRSKEDTTTARLPAEQWQVLYLGGERMGQGYTTCEEVEIEGRTLIRTRTEQSMHLKRYGQEIRSSMTIESLTTPQGELVSFRSETVAPGTNLMAEGVVETIADSRKLTITTSSQGTSEEFLVAWSKEFRGPFGMEEVLVENPLKPGEKREFTALVPMMNQAARYEYQAGKLETTELLEGEAELLRVEMKITIPGQPAISATMWVDEQGLMQKSHMEGIDQTTYAVSHEVAEKESEAPELDLGEMTIVKLATPLASPHDRQQMVYRAYLPEGDPAVTFPVSESQAVRQVDEHTAEIVVRALRGGEGAAGDGTEAGFVPSEPPSEADLAPNSLIQSDNAAVVAMAQSIAPQEQDPWQLALALERGVNGAISAKNFSQAFASAAEVAETREGDCTEHAVLLAALCRARGLPARVAMGLVYYPPEEGFAYHMWNEVWIDGRWIPLDATLGKGGIGPAHLKLAGSNLEGATAYAAFMPVMQVIGKLELNVVGVE